MPHGHKYTHKEGCCVCGTKHSSSHFRPWYDQHDERAYCKVFGMESWEGRRGMICNPCHLFVNRALKSTEKGHNKTELYRKRLESKWKGSLPRTITELLPPSQAELSGRALASSRFVRRRQSGKPVSLRVPRYVFTGMASIQMESSPFMTQLRQTGPVSDRLNDFSENLSRLYIQENDGNVGSSAGAAKASGCSSGKRERGDSEDSQPSENQRDSDLPNEEGACPSKRRKVGPILCSVRQPKSNRRCIRPPVKRLKVKHVDTFDPTYFKTFTRCCVTYHFGENGAQFRVLGENFGKCSECQWKPVKRLCQKQEQPSNLEDRVAYYQKSNVPASDREIAATMAMMSMQEGELSMQEGELSMESSDDDINETRVSDSPVTQMCAVSSMPDARLDTESKDSEC